jgi:hypothetical protein
VRREWDSVKAQVRGGVVSNAVSNRRASGARALPGASPTPGTVKNVREKGRAGRLLPGDEVERLNYGFSILHCLAVGFLDHDSAGTGTVIRPDTVRAYAAEAGFSRVDVLPIEHDFWRFYTLEP